MDPGGTFPGPALRPPVTGLGAIPWEDITLYPDAREDAVDETGLPWATFSQTCPWPFEQLMDVNFLPEEPTRATSALA
jgi:hypothetical protein